MYDVFISYSRDDSQIAERIYKALSDTGLSCFIDRQGIGGGADFVNTLCKSIKQSRILLLLGSRHSYVSRYVKNELTFALDNRLVVFPLIVDQTEIPDELKFLTGSINRRILSDKYTIEKELVEDIRQKLSNPSAGESLQAAASALRNKPRRWLFILAALVLAGLLTWILTQELKRKADRDNTRAVEALAKEATADIRKAAQLLDRADSLKNSGNALQTVLQENSLLREASAGIARADSLKRVYQAQPAYAYLFSHLSTEPYKAQVRSRLDSLVQVWNGYALSNYEEYQAFPDEVNRGIAVRYVDLALQLSPADPRLREIKEELSD